MSHVKLGKAKLRKTSLRVMNEGGMRWGTGLSGGGEGEQEG